MQAKKSLGQHFLKSEKALSQIIEAGSIKTSDTVLEIGPGQGVLTERLIEKTKHVIAIEKDTDLIPLLKDKFAKEIDSEKLIILNRDILLFDPTNYLPLTTNSSYKLIANIPYYITGAIIEQFLSTQNQPSLMVLLIQKEVAERIVSRDGKQSVLSIAVSVYGKPKIIDKVPAGAFTPPPKVDSAIILIDNISREFFGDVGEQKFFEVLKFCFSRKRKQILGSLAELLEDRTKAISVLQKSGIEERRRPETLTKEEWKLLAQNIEE